MMRTQLRHAVGLLFVLLTLVITSFTAAAQENGPGIQTVSSEITGTVVTNGFVADLGQLRIRAVPLQVRRSGGQSAPNPRATTSMATFATTADPRVLRFRISGLNPGALYQVGVAYPPNPVAPAEGGMPGHGKLFWTGPTHGMVLAGGPAIEFEAFAATTEVEIQELGSGRWVGAADLQFDDPGAAARNLRWRTSIPNVTGGELQVSTEPFPTGRGFGNCDEPTSGLVARKSLIVRGGAAEDQEISAFDFGAALAPGGRIGGGDGIGIAGVAATDVAPISEHTRSMLMIGAPVYVRVIPHTVDGPVCDTRSGGVSGWVMLAKAPPSFAGPDAAPIAPRIQPWSGSSYQPPVRLPQNRPTYGEFGYKVIENHLLPSWQDAKYGATALFDPLGTTLVQAGLFPGGTLLTKGTTFVFTPQTDNKSSDGFLSDFGPALGGLGSAFGGLVTATVGFAGGFVDYMHQLTEQIKTSLAKAIVDVASFVPGVTELCGAAASTTGKTCDDLVKAGLEYGLTSVGLPPSLPNWEQLKEQGAEYLAAEVASSLGDPTGFTGDVFLKATDIVSGSMGKVAAARGGDDWRYAYVIPYLGFEPAVWKMSVHKNIPGNLPDNLYLRVSGTPLYLGGSVRVPSRFPASNTLSIPFVLQANTVGIPAPRCTHNSLNTLFGMPEFSCVPDPTLSAPSCRSYGWNDSKHAYAWSESDCSYVNWPGIYYRDAWVAQKFATTSCTLLLAKSWAQIGGIWLPDSAEPFVSVAWIPPQYAASWDYPVYNICH